MSGAPTPKCVETASFDVLGGLASREMNYVEHRCEPCDQTTRVPLATIEWTNPDGEPRSVLVPMVRTEFLTEFADEAALRGIGHNNEGVTYMISTERSGPHRIVRCGCCMLPWSIDEIIKPWWLTPMGRTS